MYFLIFFWCSWKMTKSNCTKRNCYLFRTDERLRLGALRTEVSWIFDIDIWIKESWSQCFRKENMDYIFFIILSLDGLFDINISAWFSLNTIQYIFVIYSLFSWRRGGQWRNLPDFSFFQFFFRVIMCTYKVNRIFKT